MEDTLDGAPINGLVHRILPKPRKAKSLQALLDHANIDIGAGSGYESLTRRGGRSHQQSCTRHLIKCERIRHFCPQTYQRIGENWKRLPSISLDATAQPFRFIVPKVVKSDDSHLRNPQFP